jgi:hypothetical protein
VLQLARFFLKGGGVRYIAAQLVTKRFRVVGEYVSVFPCSRNRYIGHAVIDEALVGMFGIHVDQNTVSRFSLAAVAGHGIAEIQVGMLPQIEANDAA